MNKSIGRTKALAQNHKKQPPLLMWLDFNPMNTARSTQKCFVVLGYTQTCTTAGPALPNALVAGWTLNATDALQNHVDSLSRREVAFIGTLGKGGGGNSILLNTNLQ